MSSAVSSAVSSQSLQEQILLVDDNPENLRVLYETLDGRGYKLLVADSGEQALNIVRKSRPDLVLLDIMMPGMDGFEVCRHIKQDSRSYDTSIIFLSALDDTESKVTGFDAGGVDYISKPFQVKEVIARVETHLKIHRLERQLAAQNRELATDKSNILAAMGEGIYGLDRAGRIVFANAAACETNRCDEDSLLGKGFVSLHFQQVGIPDGENEMDLDRIAEKVQRVLNNRESLKVGHTLFCRPDGTVYPVEFNVMPTAEEDRRTCAVVVFHDISEELEQEEALAQARYNADAQRAQLAHVSRLSMMGEMAAGIAHEVNQPLTAVVNYVRVAKRLAGDDVASEDLSATLEKIEAQSLRASQVIQHIRDFVKKPAQGKDVVAGKKLADDIMELAVIEAKEHEAKLVSDIAEPLPMLNIEEVQVQQVALNLLRNGMEAMEQAEVEGELLFRVYQDGNVCRFEIVDAGPGIDESVQSHLFSPFFTTKSSGMGIGLTLCQSIIHSHGGEIGYMPNEAGGSTFFFTLPAR